jgi:hypothetical protein
MRKIEKAQYATHLKSIKRRGYDRLYFGAEFCQWRMPAAASVVKAFERACEYGMGFTLLTPWVTDAGLGKVELALRALGDAATGYGGTGPEVVVNDFGVLLVMREMKSRLTPVLGRLLTRQKRCPRIPGIMEGLPDEGRELYLHAGIEDPVSAKLLRRFNVRRVELDNPPQGLKADLFASGFKGTLYTPYAYVTLTRHCPGSFDGRTWRSFTGCRIMACVSNVMEMENPAHGQPLIMRGNVQFVMNPVLPDTLSEMGIDRVVYMEGVP